MFISVTLWSDQMGTVSAMLENIVPKYLETHKKHITYLLTLDRSFRGMKKEGTIFFSSVDVPTIAIAETKFDVFLHKNTGSQKILLMKHFIELKCCTEHLIS